MSETANYGLYLEDNDQTKFKVWREKINGTIDSNMMKIDAALNSHDTAIGTINTSLGAVNTSLGDIDDALGEIDSTLSGKANSSEFRSSVLLASAWEDGMQTISVAGLTADQNGVIGVAKEITEDELDAVYSAGLYISGQATGQITISAKGNVPKIDIPITIILLG